MVGGEPRRYVVVVPSTQEQRDLGYQDPLEYEVVAATYKVRDLARDTFPVPSPPRIEQPGKPVYNEDDPDYVRESNRAYMSQLTLVAAVCLGACGYFGEESDLKKQMDILRGPAHLGGLNGDQIGIIAKCAVDASAIPAAKKEEIDKSARPTGSSGAPEA
jgi:hypothetical protein